MDWDMSEAYERYASSVPSTVKNERIRPEGQSIFDWLLEDKELIYETDRDIRKAGFEW
jgi:hypothetical protein